eukprot:3087166-Rhodomonas_salina.1
MLSLQYQVSLLSAYASLPVLRHTPPVLRREYVPTRILMLRPVLTWSAYPCRLARTDNVPLVSFGLSPVLLCAYGGTREGCTAVVAQ